MTKADDGSCSGAPSLKASEPMTPQQIDSLLGLSPGAAERRLRIILDKLKDTPLAALVRESRK